MPEIALVAGEASGDAAGAALTRELRSLCPALTIWGAGSSGFKKAGVELITDISCGGAIGIVQSLKIVPGLINDYWKVRRAVLDRRPDLLVMIDFGAFNVRLGCTARKAGIKTLYYFPPSSWRKKLKSTERIKRCADKVITPFPWSEQLLRADGIDASFVGHPLLDMVKPEMRREEFFRYAGLDLVHRVVGLLPGSRGHEIDYNLPALLQAAEIIKTRLNDVGFVIAAGSAKSRERITGIVKRMGHSVPVVESLTYDVMTHSNMLITCSGTATLETAIAGTPMVIIYRGGGAMILEYLIRKARVLETFIGMPNIIAEKEICPELLAEKATPEAIAGSALDILENPERYALIRDSLGQVRAALGEPGAVLRVAGMILDMVGV